MGVHLCSQAVSDRTKGRSLGLHQRRLMLDLRMNSIPERVIRHWDGLLRDVVESPCPKVFKERLDVALSVTL